MKRLVLTMLALAALVSVKAQVGKEENSLENAMSEYEKFRQQALKEYDDFRKKANEEYARFLAEAWKSFDSKPGEEIPWKPKPKEPLVDDGREEVAPEPRPRPNNETIQAPDPVKIPDPSKPNVPDKVDKRDPVTVPDLGVVDDSAPVPELTPNAPSSPTPDPVKPIHGRSQQIHFEGVVSAPKHIDRPQPIEPIVAKPVAVVPTQTLYMYGSSFPFYYQKVKSLKLKDASEKSVAAMWNQLSDSSFDDVIADCLRQREERNLCDWAYVKLTKSVAEKYFGQDTNEAVVMQMYLLTQSGYQMRIARADKRLTLLIGSKEKIYHYKYFELDGLKFYVLDRSIENVPMSICNHAFPKEKPFSLAMMQPKLNVERTTQRTIVSKRYPDVKVTVETNQNLIDFYNDCPISAQWNYYSVASLSDVVKESLYPALRKAIAGKSDLEAANILLNFVQTGFEYATDQEQFGYERPLYPDESIFYPYCDCEDRAVLYTCLVRELLGLETVLLNYPEHLAAAVHFNEEVEGDYIVFEGKTYLVTDPTFIGAPVGRCAKQYKAAKPKVVKI